MTLSVNPLALMRLALLLALLAWAGPRGTAQTVSQTIDLRPGWNAVFLELDPQPDDAGTVFGALPIESAWLWNESYGAPQFVQDPSKLTPETPEWLKYFAPGAVSNNLTTLNTVLGGRAYLIKLGGNQNRQLTIQGRPRLRAPRWIADRYAMVGFYLDPTKTPTFQQFFAPSTAHANQPMFKLTAQGTWARVTAPAAETMKAGEAYWIYSNGPSTYWGPLGIDLRLFNALEFGAEQDELPLGLRNLATAARTITIRKLSTTTSPDPADPLRAGDVPLGRYVENLTQGIREYQPLPDPLTVALGASQSNELTLQVRRPEFASFTPPSASRASRYEAVLQVEDGAAMRYRIPVTALPLGEGSAAQGDRPKGLKSGGPQLLSGLWVGQVEVNAVNEPRSTTDGALPRPTATPFQFRILLHIDGQNRARLLQSALIMFREAELGPLAGNPPTRAVQTPGRYVIITDDSLLGLKQPDGITPVYTGAALRDGVEVGRRISSANFSLAQPQLMTGNLTSTATLLQTTLTIPFNDPLNPYVHAFHPDHDNKDRQFVPYTTGGEEGFQIQRTLRLTFGQQSLTDIVTAGYGARVLDGIYEETLTGLHRVPLRVRGTFSLARVLETDVLNDGR